MIKKNLFIALCCISIYTLSLCNRPRISHTSYPYIASGTFRAFCDFIIEDKRDHFNPLLVQPGSTIYIGTNIASLVQLVEYFFTKWHPRIRHPYILITHSSDQSLPGTLIRYANDPKILAWFTMNMDAQHPKVFPLPIGFVHKLSPSGNTDFFDEITKDLPTLYTKKDKLVYANFTTETNPGERRACRDACKEKSFITYAKRKPFKDYMHDIAHHKFVLSPAGTGLDCHRTWEALLVGSVPVVKTSTLDPLYEGLPVLIVQDWSDITEELLENYWQENLSFIMSFNREKLYADYWFAKIKEAACKTL